MDNTLDVYRFTEHVGRFTKDGNTVTFEYLPNATRPISISLPLSGNWHRDAPKHWLTALLPSKRVLNNIAKTANLPKNYFAVLGYLGTDVAGDCILINEYSNTDHRAVPTELSSSDLDHRIRDAKNGHLDPLTLGSRFSLAGAQSKFSVTLNNGRFYTSTLQNTSTHIIKPGNYKLRGIDGAEAGLHTLASAIGVPAALSSVLHSAAGSAFISQRFDRNHGQRTATEDLTQVLALPESAKYTHFDPALVFQTLKSAGFDDSQLYALVAQIVYNTHVGNSDAHLKNYSVFIDSKTICPLYDCVPIGAFPMYSQRLPIAVNGKHLPEYITLDDWRYWVDSLSLDSSIVSRIVQTITAGLNEHSSRILDEFKVDGYIQSQIKLARAGLC